MKMLFQFCCTLLFSATLLAQSSTLNRKYSTLDVNRVKTLITNYGVVAQHSELQPRGAWKYFNNGYFGDFSFVLGVELPVKDYDGNGSLDTIHGVVITPVSRPGGGKEIDGIFSGFEPVAGYNNPNATDDNGVALSDRSSSWPQSWPDHPEYPSFTWNGLLGPNVFLPGREAYYVLNDANERKYYNLYGFLPDSTNPTRKGYGLDVKVRIIQSTIPELMDALIFVYDIKNNSKYTYNKMVLGELTGTYIGIFGNEWDDDYTCIYSKEDLVITGDYDSLVRRSSNQYWIGKPGLFGNAFIQSPGKQKIGSFDYFAPSSNIKMAADEDMWNRLLPGKRRTASNVVYGTDSIPRVLHGQDGDNIYGTHYFSLAPGGSKRIVSVLAFGKTTDEIYDKILAASAMYYNNFDKAQLAARLQLSTHMNHPQISGFSNIQWQSATPGVGTVNISYSADKGATWQSVAENFANTGSYAWNTLPFKESSFGMLRLVLVDAEGNKTAMIKSNMFTLNNAANGAPYITVNVPENMQYFTNNQDISFTAGDPDNNSLHVKIYGTLNSNQDGFLLLEKDIPSDTLDQTINIPLGLLPNADNYCLKAYLSDGVNTSSAISESFSKWTQTGLMNNANYNFITTINNSVQMQFRIADSSRIKSHSYLITFDDTSYPGVKKLYSVWSKDRQSFVVKDKELVPLTESEMFDGMFMKTTDFVTRMDTTLSKWHLATPTPSHLLTFSTVVIPPYKPVRSPRNYKFVFSDTYNDSSNNLNAMLGGEFPVYTKLNYKIYDVTRATPKPVKFALISDSPGLSDTLSRDDMIVLADEAGTKIAWMLRFNGSQNSYIPRSGDELYFYTEKGLSFYDTLMLYNLTVDVSPTQMPVGYSVSQNYPNPFNPSTVIEYTVPERSLVTVQVFNTLGQLIKTVVKAEQNTGKYTVDLHMQGYASGMYLYRVSVGNRTVTKKMMLLK